ncbi:MAG: nucleotidyltransferase domain-containing protein [Bacteroidales bacterium]|nr:nucleotidyltransferase domain-containing protein [Bacteroidales bacterium]
MISRKILLAKIKEIVLATEPLATVVLYGSFARGNQRKESDVDVLILLDKEALTYEDERHISDPLYDLEFDTGKVISPIIFTRKEWEGRHKITPFYQNIEREGVLL